MAFSDTGTRATRSNVERSAMLQAAWEGFTKSPLVGQGSWFSNSNVMDEFLAIRMQNARIAGVGGFAEDDAEGMAIHSQILVALAEGGLFGAAFFFAYGALLLWGLWFCLTDAPWDWTLPIGLFVLLVAFWNLLMSPFSGTHRVEIAMAVGLLLILWRQRAQLRYLDSLQVAQLRCLASLSGTDESRSRQRRQRPARRRRDCASCTWNPGASTEGYNACSFASRKITSPARRWNRSSHFAFKNKWRRS